MRKLFLTTAVAAATLAGAASAQTVAAAGTDLNLRSGPNSTAEIIGVIANGDEVSVTGCIESANWCQVTYKDQEGWAYGDYLTAKVGEKIEPLYPNRQSVGVAVVEAPAVEPATQAADAAVGGAAGAAVGALVGGPVGAIVGAAIGGSTAAAVTPAPEIQTYITANPQTPVTLDGEVVVGAGIPDTVTLYDIPDHPDYKYVVVNNQPVLVNPADRKIVHIYR